MSVIVCQVTEDTITIGSDSAVSYGDCDQLLIPGEKLFVERDIVIGATGHLEQTKLLKWFLQLNDVQYSEDVRKIREADVFGLFLQFQEWCDQFGYDLKDENRDNLAQILIVIEGKAFYVNGHNVRRITDYAAIGCGEAHSRGALHAGASIERAIDAACVFNQHCEYPILIMSYDIQTGQVEETVYQKGDPLP